MEELKEKTSDVLYENYRSDKLMSMGVEQDQTVFKEVKYSLPLPLPHYFICWMDINNLVPR
jgi:septin family protein